MKNEDNSNKKITDFNKQSITKQRQPSESSDEMQSSDYMRFIKYYDKNNVSLYHAGSDFSQPIVEESTTFYNMQYDSLNQLPSEVQKQLEDTHYNISLEQNKQLRDTRASSVYGEYFEEMNNYYNESEQLTENEVNNSKTAKPSHNNSQNKKSNYYQNQEEEKVEKNSKSWNRQ